MSAKQTADSPTPEQIAAKVLESVGERAQGFDPPMRAAIEFLIGETYQQAKMPAPAEKHLVSAYDTVRYLNDRDEPGINFLKGDIIAATVKAAPLHVERALPGSDSLRDMALQGLVDYYTSRREYEHAIELFNRMESDTAVASAARTLMMALGSEHPNQRARVFTGALNAYRARPHPYISAGYPEDLGSLVVRFWRDLPPPLVHEAIDELLSQARPENAPENSQVRKSGISATGTAGMVAFRSFYEFRVFQLAPILRAIDPTETERLLKQSKDARYALQKYPQGEHSLDPTFRDTPLKKGEVSAARFAITTASTTGPKAADMEVRRLTEDRVAAIAEDAREHPQQALADAASLPQVDARVAALVAIAQALVKSDPTTAAAALKQGLTSARSQNSHARLSYALQAGPIWLRLHDADGAKAALDLGLQQARDEYDEDANEDDPNLALKLYWPSTQVWRDLIAFAAKISPETALAAVNDVPDEAVKALEQVFLAGVWMKVEPWRGTSPIVAHQHEQP